MSTLLDKLKKGPAANLDGIKNIYPVMHDKIVDILSKYEYYWEMRITEGLDVMCFISDNEHGATLHDLGKLFKEE